MRPAPPIDSRDKTESKAPETSRGSVRAFAKSATPLPAKSLPRRVPGHPSIVRPGCPGLPPFRRVEMHDVWRSSPGCGQFRITTTAACLVGRATSVLARPSRTFPERHPRFAQFATATVSDRADERLVPPQDHLEGFALPWQTSVQRSESEAFSIDVGLIMVFLRQSSGPNSRLLSSGSFPIKWRKARRR